MIPIKALEKYCKQHLIKHEFVTHNIIDISGKLYLIVDDESILFDSEFKPIIKTDLSVDGFVYQFCGRWYIQDKDLEVTELKELLNIGEPDQKIPTKSFLGIHSGNELLNGVGLYKDWVEKAKFLGVDTLGICEKNTLSGAMSFQNICKANGIKSIIGMTISVKNGLKFYELKVYASNFNGWQNLLKYNHVLNILGEANVEESFVRDNSDGVVIVIDPKYTKFEDQPDFTNYYQLDTVVFEDEEVDSNYLNNLEQFIKSGLSPVKILDAYYVEKRDWEVREKLWGIAKSFDFRTKNQFFKNDDQYAKELISLFEDGNKSWIKLYKDATSNLDDIISKCDFTYDSNNRHLPKYKMTKEESEKFSENKDLFIHLIKKGFKNRGIDKADKKKYLKRLNEEIKVLKDGDVIDYFLILHDIIQFAKSEDILIGIGRGSAGGSLVSYLLDIIQLDPIEFDLLFSRFLNPGRMGKVVECDAYEIVGENGDTIKLNEGSLLKIVRNGEVIVSRVEDLEEGDEIKKY